MRRSRDARRDVLQALQRKLTKTQFENFVLLMLALSIGRNFILWHLAVSVVLPISIEAAYKRLQRLANSPIDLDQLKQAWLEVVIERFARPGQTLTLFIDWTMHTDRCRSLWVQLGIACGRSVPLAFWLHANHFAGKGQQRRFEDDALRQLKAWLPAGWPVRIVGDRGFGGRDRMSFIEGELGWQFIFRITGDGRLARRRMRQTPKGKRLGVSYSRVDSRPPKPGQSWYKPNVRYGRSHSITVNLVAVCQPASSPSAQKDPVWYLATNWDAQAKEVASCYSGRMEIEESFRDMKAELGMEKEYTRQPEQRLRWLMLAVMVVLGRMMWYSQQQRAQRCFAEVPKQFSEPSQSNAEQGKRYRSVSDMRRGWQALLVEVMLDDHSLLRQVVKSVAAKAQRMADRPQVKFRRKSLTTKNRSSTTVKA